MKKAAAILICAIFGLTAAACARVYKADDTVFNSELQFSVRMYGGDTEKAYEEMLALMDRLAALPTEQLEKLLVGSDES